MAPPPSLQSLLSLRSRHSQRPHAEQTSPIFQLPPELIDLIVNRLPVYSLITLALTCRTLYQRFPPDRSISSRDREELCLLLERGSPTRCYCFIHHKLHSRVSLRWRDVGLHHRPTNGDKVATLPCLGEQTSFTAGPFRLRFCEAHLATLRARRGPPFGIEHSQLNARIKSTPCRETGVVVSQTWHAAVRGPDADLVLRADWTFRHPRGDKAQLWRFIHGSASPTMIRSTWVCGHLCTETPRRRWTDRPAWRVPELEGSEDEVLVEGVGRLRSCAYCMTDYQLSILNQPPRGRGRFFRGSHHGGWEVLVVAWYQLGTCESPTDWNWRIMADRGLLQPPGRRDLYPAGYVRKRWDGSDRPDEPNEAFVGMAPPQQNG